MSFLSCSHNFPVTCHVSVYLFLFIFFEVIQRVNLAWFKPPWHHQASARILMRFWTLISTLLRGCAWSGTELIRGHRFKPLSEISQWLFKSWDQCHLIESAQRLLYRESIVRAHEITLESFSVSLSLKQTFSILLWLRQGVFVMRSCNRYE